MIKFRKSLVGLLLMVVFNIAVAEANSACAFWLHQSKLPDSVKALRKF